VKVDSLIRAGVVLAAVVALSACGGAGDTGGAGGAGGAASVQGVYRGTTTIDQRTLAFKSIILEDGQIWVAWGEQDAGGALLVEGFLQGTRAATGTNWDVRRWFEYSGRVILIDGVLRATIEDGLFDGRFSIPIAPPESGIHFERGTLFSDDEYVYNTPAQTVDIEGVWDMTSLGRLASNPRLTIYPDGLYTGTFTTMGTYCNFGGTFTPRQSDKNIFDAMVTFDGWPCPHENETAHGVGILTRLLDGRQQLIVGFLDDGRNSSDMLFGTRPQP